MYILVAGEGKGRADMYHHFVAPRVRGHQPTSFGVWYGLIINTFYKVIRSTEKYVLNIYTFYKEIRSTKIYVLVHFEGRYEGTGQGNSANHKTHRQNTQVRCAVPPAKQRRGR